MSKEIADSWRMYVEGLDDGQFQATVEPERCAHPKLVSKSTLRDAMQERSVWACESCGTSWPVSSEHAGEFWRAHRDGRLPR